MSLKVSDQRGRGGGGWRKEKGEIDKEREADRNRYKGWKEAQRHLGREGCRGTHTHKERGRHTERARERDVEVHTHTHTHRERGRHTERAREKDVEVHRERGTEKVSRM